MSLTDVDAKLAVIAMLRNLCTSGTVTSDNPLPLSAVLATPVETLIRWVQLDVPMLDSVRGVLDKVRSNLDTARSQAMVTGAVAVTYDGITWPVDPC
jgi:hypothetical protein